MYHVVIKLYELLDTLEIIRDKEVPVEEHPPQPERGHDLVLVPDVVHLEQLLLAVDDRPRQDPVRLERERVEEVVQPRPAWAARVVRPAVDLLREVGVLRGGAQERVTQTAVRWLGSWS